MLQRRLTLFMFTTTAAPPRVSLLLADDTMLVLIVAWPLLASAIRMPIPGAHRAGGTRACAAISASSGVGIKSGPGIEAPDLPSDQFTADFTPKSPRKADWTSAYTNHLEEEAYEITDVEGEIPTDLHGTLFRNGPGRLERGGHAYSHLFDGDGIIHAFAFRDGRCSVRNAFVKTAEWCKEEAAGALKYRNTFGTQPRGGWRSNAFNVIQKNVANTNILFFGGKLLALWEAAQPYALDPESLATIGLETLNNQLQPGMPFTTGIPLVDKLAAGVVGDPLTAHPKVDVPSPDDADDARNGKRLVTYGYRAKPSAAAVAAGRGAFDSELMLYEFDEQWNAVRRRPIFLDGFAFVHDFVVTQHYCIWFQNPCDFDPLPFVLGEKNPAELISYDPTRSTQIHVVPRDPSDATRRQRRLTIPACFVFHHARGFELTERSGGEGGEGGVPGGEELVIDSVVLDAFPAFDQLTRPPDDADREALKALDFQRVPINRFVRFNIDLSNPDDAAAVTQRTPRPRAAEFPTTGAVAPRAPHRYVYGACVAHASLNNPFQGVVRVDMETGEEAAHFPGPRRFTNEPVFVPRPGCASEDDGYLLVLVYDAEVKRSGLYIYDARKVEAGPVGVAWLRRSIPYGLHGSFVQGETFGAL